MTEFTVTIEDADRGLLVTAAGPLDLATASQLETVVEARRPLSGDVVLDLLGVTFLDPSGLRAIVGVRRAALDDDAEPPMLRCDGRVRQYLVRTGVLDAFRTTP